jgi:hypothetical protein
LSPVFGTRRDLEKVAACCPEFKSFLNSLLAFAEYEPLA